MDRYIKNQLAVNAEEYAGTAEQLASFEENGLSYRSANGVSLSTIIIKTSSGEKTVSIGDFIVRGPQGEFDSCQADLFRQLYSPETEPVEEEEAEGKKTESVLKRNIIVYCIIGTFISGVIFGSILYNEALKSVRKNVKSVVEVTLQEEITRASDERLKEAEIEAAKILVKAKEDAIIAADQAFRDEMRRITDDKLRK